jgi:hypothetical protein
MTANPRLKCLKMQLLARANELTRACTNRDKDGRVTIAILFSEPVIYLNYGTVCQRCEYRNGKIYRAAQISLKETTPQEIERTKRILATQFALSITRLISTSYLP